MVSFCFWAWVVLLSVVVAVVFSGLLPRQAIRSLGPSTAGTGLQVVITATANAAGTVTRRVMDLVAATRLACYTWIVRGLFPQHKLTLLAQVVLTLLRRDVEGVGTTCGYSPAAEAVLLRGREAIVRDQLMWQTLSQHC